MSFLSDSRSSLQRQLSVDINQQINPTFDAISTKSQRLWLVCIDGTDISYKSLEWSMLFLHRNKKDRLLIVHVYDEEKQESGEYNERKVVIEEKIRAIVAGEFPKYMYEVVCIKLKNNIHETVSDALITIALKRKPFITLLGYKTSEKSNIVFNNLLNNMINATLLPHMIVKEKTYQPNIGESQKFISVIDGTHASLLTVRTACALMKDTDILHVVHNFSSNDVDSEILFKIQLEKMEKAVSKILLEYNKVGDFKLIEGNFPMKSLFNYVTSEQASFLVVYRNKTKEENTEIGEKSEVCIRNSTCNVIICRSE